jgi:hypothetical protein
MQLLLVGLISIAFTYGSIIGITPLILAGFGGVVAFYYLLYRLDRFEEQIGLANLPKTPKWLEQDHDGTEPEHDPPPPPDPKSWGVTDEGLEFFHHHENFGRVLNEYFAYIQSSWRLRELPDSDVGTLTSMGPVLGRQFEVLYGNGVVGHLALQPGWQYALDHPEVIAESKIEDARSFPARDLISLLTAIADHIAGDTRDDIERASRVVRDAMLDSMWLVGPRVLIQPETLDVRLQGTGKFYLQRAGLVPRERSALDDMFDDIRNPSEPSPAR